MNNNRLTVWKWLIVILSVVTMILFFENSKTNREVENLKSNFENEIYNLRVEISNLKCAIDNENSISKSDSGFEIENSNSTIDFDYDFDYVVRVVGAEARGESWEGVMAVVQTIANRAEIKGITPEEVVKEKVGGVRQYAAPMPSSDFDNGDTVGEICLLVLLYGEKIVDENITHFCTSQANSWHSENLEFVCKIGNLEFYKEVC